MHLLHCAYNAGVIMKLNKNNLGDTILQQKNSCHSWNCWKSLSSLLFITVTFLCIYGMHSRGLKLMSYKSAVYNLHCKVADDIARLLSVIFETMWKSSDWRMLQILHLFSKKVTIIGMIQLASLWSLGKSWGSYFWAWIGVTVSM